ncbi:hypothetical protein B0A49_10699 [Cryomyces minteri]|uniref:ADP-ribosylation factor n=1 Tax=Cryomyces minteri TaxID=331657 RepID=A0A4U0W5L4_9PEZI|nr:hypothetical protein B0A49_10699 [Cryomyces minteri]
MDADHPQASTPRPLTSTDPQLPEYYQDIGVTYLLQEFKNLDDRASFELFERAVGNPKTGNFVVDFGDEEAWCGFDLAVDAFNGLLEAKRPAALNTRWINIWYPADHKPTLQEKSPVPSLDLEEGSETTELSSLSELDPLHNINHYSIVDDVWHYSSVDWGRRYVCLGYNSLYSVPTERREDEYPQSHRDLPDGKRVWTWLLLCEDRTVISIHEDPYPYKNGDLDKQEQRALNVIRRNLLNVFRQLSKARNSAKESPLTILPIRKQVGDSKEETLHRPTDAPGLLFYYLFDDWYTSYGLVVKREHQHGAELNQLREAMLQKAELSHVDRLHHIGRQLAVLKRIHQSYERIIDRVLEKQKATLASLTNSNILPGLQREESVSSSQPQIAEAESLLGVSLSSAARVRFERLKDLIRLYALSEIQDCLDQKESLVMMNFNLIAIKESYSVERLTRITLLLAKVTILFMPVSLMTAYFSTQLQDVRFTSHAYWTAFAVVLSASICALMLFGAVSGTLEGRMVVRPLSRVLVDFWRGKVGGSRTGA